MSARKKPGSVPEHRREKARRGSAEQQSPRRYPVIPSICFENVKESYLRWLVFCTSGEIGSHNGRRNELL